MQENIKQKRSIRSISLIIAVAMFFVAAASLAFPYARKANTVKSISADSVHQLEALSLALGHYSTDSIETIRTNKTIGTDYLDLSALLFKAKNKFNYNKLYILAKNPPDQYFYIADGDYRDNGVNGSDYMSPENTYSLDIYQSGRTAIEQIFYGKIQSGYAKNLIISTNKATVVTSYLPITSSKGDVIAILGADRDPGSTAYNMVGFIDLYIVGMGALAVMAIALLVWFIAEKWDTHKKSKLASKPEPTIDPITIPEEATVVEIPQQEILEETAPPEQPQENLPQ